MIFLLFLLSISTARISQISHGKDSSGHGSCKFEAKVRKPEPGIRPPYWCRNKILSGLYHHLGKITLIFDLELDGKMRECGKCGKKTPFRTKSAARGSYSGRLLYFYSTICQAKIRKTWSFTNIKSENFF